MRTQQTDIVRGVECALNAHDIADSPPLRDTVLTHKGSYRVLNGFELILLLSFLS